MRGRKQRREWISCPFNTQVCTLITRHEPGKRQFTYLTLTVKFSLSLSLCVFTRTLSVSPPFRPSIFALLDAPKPPAEDRFIMPDEFVAPEVEEQGRSKRSPINSNRVGGLNVETLVVADRKMLEKHGRDNVTTYVLTVMNMVRVGEEKERRRWNVKCLTVKSRGCYRSQKHLTASWLTAMTARQGPCDRHG